MKAQSDSQQHTVLGPMSNATFNPQHFKTSSNSSQGGGGTSSSGKGGFSKIKAKQIIKSFDSRGLPGGGVGNGVASSSNQSAQIMIQSFYGGGGTVGTGSGGGPQGGVGKKHKSSAGSSNCHSSFSNERKKPFDGSHVPNIYASCDNRLNGGSNSGGATTQGGGGGPVISGSVSMLTEFQQAYFNQQRLQQQKQNSDKRQLSLGAASHFFGQAGGQPQAPMSHQQFETALHQTLLYFMYEQQVLFDGQQMIDLIFATQDARTSQIGAQNAVHGAAHLQSGIPLDRQMRKKGFLNQFITHDGGELSIATTQGIQISKSGERITAAVNTTAAAGPRKNSMTIHQRKISAGLPLSTTPNSIPNNPTILIPQSQISHPMQVQENNAILKTHIQQKLNEKQEFKLSQNEYSQFNHQLMQSFIDRRAVLSLKKRQNNNPNPPIQQNFFSGVANINSGEGVISSGGPNQSAIFGTAAANKSITQPNSPRQSIKAVQKKSDKSKSNQSSFANASSGGAGQITGIAGPTIPEFYSSYAYTAIRMMIFLMSMPPCSGNQFENVSIMLNEKLILIQQQQQNQQPNQVSNMVNKIVLPKGIIRFNNSSANRGNSTGSKSAEKTTRKGGKSHEPREESLRRLKKVQQIIKNFEQDRNENHSNPARSQVQGLLISQVEPHTETAHGLGYKQPPHLNANMIPSQNTPGHQEQNLLLKPKIFKQGRESSDNLFPGQQQSVALALAADHPMVSNNLNSNDLNKQQQKSKIIWEERKREEYIIQIIKTFPLETKNYIQSDILFLSWLLSVHPWGTCLLLRSSLHAGSESVTASHSSYLDTGANV